MLHIKGLNILLTFLLLPSWILNWLSDQPYSKNTSRFSVSTSILRAGQRLPGEGLDALLPPVYFLPAPGN
jgi:chaperone BCS1